MIEQAFGWMKTIGLLRKLRHRGGDLVDWVVTFTATAFNLTRMRTCEGDVSRVTQRRARLLHVDVPRFPSSITVAVSIFQTAFFISLLEFSF